MLQSCGGVVRTAAGKTLDADIGDRPGRATHHGDLTRLGDRAGIRSRGVLSLERTDAAVFHDCHGLDSSFGTKMRRPSMGVSVLQWPT